MGTDLFSEFNLIDDFHRLKFQFSAPLSLRTARVMKFAQHGKHRRPSNNRLRLFTEIMWPLGFLAVPSLK
jgi:hypothetical protein